MIQIIIDKNTNIDKEKQAIELLQELINQDKKRNDLKSLNYHTLALNEHKKYLETIQNERSK